MFGKSVFGSNFEQDNAKIVLKRCKKLKMGFTKNLNVKIDTVLLTRSIIVSICDKHKLKISFNAALQRSRA